MDRDQESGGRSNLAAERARIRVKPDTIMPASNPGSKTKLKAKRKPRVERFWLEIEIGDWDWNFAFGLQTLKGNTDPYADYRHLNIRGIIRGPQKYRAKSIEITCYPEIDLNRDNRAKRNPKAVGVFEKYREELSANIHMPADALPSVLQMLIATRYRFVILEAMPFERGYAMIQSYYFDEKLQEDELASPNV
jgi:hypothetical protein